MCLFLKPCLPVSLMRRRSNTRILILCSLNVGKATSIRQHSDELNEQPNDEKARDVYTKNLQNETAARERQHRNSILQMARKLCKDVTALRKDTSVNDHKFPIVLRGQITMIIAFD